MITLVFVATPLDVYPSPKTTFILECESVVFERVSYDKNVGQVFEVQDDDILLPSVFYEYRDESTVVHTLKVSALVGGEYKHITIANGTVFSMNSQGATVNKQHAYQSV